MFSLVWTGSCEACDAAIQIGVPFHESDYARELILNCPNCYQEMKVTATVIDPPVEPSGDMLIDVDPGDENDYWGV